MLNKEQLAQLRRNNELWTRKLASMSVIELTGWWYNLLEHDRFDCTLLPPEYQATHFAKRHDEELERMRQDHPLPYSHLVDSTRDFPETQWIFLDLMRGAFGESVTSSLATFYGIPTDLGIVVADESDVAQERITLVENTIEALVGLGGSDSPMWGAYRGAGNNAGWHLLQFSSFALNHDFATALHGSYEAGRFNDLNYMGMHDLNEEYFSCEAARIYRSIEKAAEWGAPDEFSENIALSMQRLWETVKALPDDINQEEKSVTKEETAYGFIRDVFDSPHPRLVTVLTELYEVGEFRSLHYFKEGCGKKYPTIDEDIQAYFEKRKGEFEEGLATD